MPFTWACRKGWVVLPLNFWGLGHWGSGHPWMGRVGTNQPRWHQEDPKGTRGDPVVPSTPACLRPPVTLGGGGGAGREARAAPAPASWFFFSFFQLKKNVVKCTQYKMCCFHRFYMSSSGALSTVTLRDDHQHRHLQALVLSAHRGCPSHTDFQPSGDATILPSPSVSVWRL